MLKYSFVISVSNDRLNSFYDLFNSIGLNTPLPTLYDGFKINGVSGDLNISITHNSIVRLAKALNYPFVCIFEDDAYPCNQIVPLLNFYLGRIPDDAKILKLGYTKCRDNLSQNVDKFFVRRSTWGAHAYIVFNSGYDDYLNLSKINIISDDALFNMDGSYNTSKNLFI